MTRTRRGAARLAAAAAQGADSALGGLAGLGVAPARAIGASREEMAAEAAGSQFAVDGIFHNREPMEAPGPSLDTAWEMARRPGRPSSPIPVLTPQLSEQVGQLSATWLGHASVLVELDGVRILTDPVFSSRCSPSQTLGPKRMHPVPVTVGSLPNIDVVLISHDHYDHLDTATIDALAALHPQAQFVVPVGVGAHLRSWGVAADRIHQADWYQHVTLEFGATSIRFHATAARHFSGRGLQRNPTQWVSWGVVGRQHRFFFSGDTGFTERYSEVGDLLGPFDLTLIAVGAYDPGWADIHVNPEEALTVHQLLNPGAARDALLLPIHWGTFNLAVHSWADPIQRLLTGAGTAGVDVCVPQPGGTVDVTMRNGTGYNDPNWWEHCA